MPNSLHLDAGARRWSLSRRVGAEFATSWRAARPDGGYRHRDLAADPLPHITEGWTELCDLVLAEGLPPLERLGELVRTPAQRTAWAIVEPLLDELLAADVVLIGTPMYNFSIRPR
ncbi:NAD(P)H-dependent oxidoreductase [Nocardia takedensis]